MRRRAGPLLLLVLPLLLAACGDGTAATTDDAGAASTTTTTDASGGGEECLVGEWVADVDSYIEGFAGYLERVGGPTLAGVTGSLAVSMDGDRFTATFTDWTVSLTLPGGAGQTTVITNGDQTGAYTGTDGTLTVVGIESTLTTSGSVVIGGIETDLSEGPIGLDAYAQANLFAEPVPYTCEGDRLVLDAIVPDAGEAFTTALDRVG